MTEIIFSLQSRHEKWSRGGSETCADRSSDKPHKPHPAHTRGNIKQLTGSVKRWKLEDG